MAREKTDFDQIKYQQEYNKLNYDRIGITLHKGKKALVKEAALNAGQSVNEYVVTAIFQRMEREGVL